MKKIIAWTLMLTLLLALFTACGTSEEAKAPETADPVEEQNEPLDDETVEDEIPVEDEPDASSPREVTEEEAFAETGISFILPEGVEIEKYLLITEEDSVFPQVDFTYEGKRYHYRIQPTNELAPYNFSLDDLNWDENLTMSMYGTDYEAHVCKNVGYIGWVDIVPGLGHNIFAEECSTSDLSIVADAIFKATNPDWENIVVTPEGYDLFSGLWKYNDFDAYIRIASNYTYTTYGADRNAVDDVVRFCRVLEDNENVLVLYNEFGGESMVLTAAIHEDGSYTVTNEAGDTLEKFGEAMNGTYHVYFPLNGLDGETLDFFDINDSWVADYDVMMLDVGSVIKYTTPDMFDITVESLEKKDDTTYIINGEQELVYVETAKAWKLTDLDGMMEHCGTCRVTENTEFTDNTGSGCETFPDFVEKVSSGYGTLTIENGEAVSITIEY